MRDRLDEGTGITKKQTDLSDLPKNEQEVIIKFNGRITDFPARVVPLPTHFLLSLNGTDWDDLLHTTTQLIDSLKNYYRLDMTKGEMIGLLQSDFLQGDIPIFTEKFGVLYWGSPEHRIRIGEKT